MKFKKDPWNLLKTELGQETAQKWHQELGD